MSDVTRLLEAIRDNGAGAAEELLPLVYAELEAAEPRKAELVKLRHFVGMTFEEAPAALGIAVPTASGGGPMPAHGSRSNSGLTRPAKNSNRHIRSGRQMRM